MISEQEVKNLNSNADKYIFMLALLEKAYKDKKINKKIKKEYERKLDFAFSRNYWKLNPFIKENPLISKVAISFLKGYYFT